ncbi:nesprin-2 isoform X2 [Cololabis saira]|uniref:nesprin-2 isoform X2 n=1 Tax=Cololabis saira TaxID=129043 RepID=UPI002AD4943D|nr:nesprin-2 isoform X2 [Cololabis saira]
MPAVAPPTSDRPGDAPESPGDEGGDVDLEPGDGSWTLEGDLQECGGLDRRWVLWHQFMKEQHHLDAWLRLAERSLDSLSPAPFTYSVARDDLRRVQRLRGEAGNRLVQLDGLTRQNRTLTRLFQGAMMTRLLASARELGRRWDEVSAGVEAAAARLQDFVSEWEEFEQQRAELNLLLTDMAARLEEAELQPGSSCEKLQRLQSFQEGVCETSCRVNALLRRGEALMQRGVAPGDAQRLEAGLEELLRRCSRVYGAVARTHTRLLVLRLVFEDDWTDSGCPSEAVAEDDPDLPSAPTRVPSSERPPPLPSHDPAGLEWDPSGDVGRSVSHDDADSSYFSAGRRDELQGRSFLGASDWRSDIIADITNQEVGVGQEEEELWLGHAHPSPLAPPTLQQDDLWMTSTPERKDGQPGDFQGGRVKAWLRVQSSAPPEMMTTSCCRAVQTEEDEEEVGEEPCCCDEAEQLRPGPSRTSGRRWSFPPVLLHLLLAAVLALLASVFWVVMEPPCHRSNRVPRTLHLALRYVNGPPPT